MKELKKQKKTFSNALLNSLRRGINNDVNTIDTFLNTSMETLSQRPQTVEEIGDANAKHSEFAKSKKDVSNINCNAWK